MATIAVTDVVKYTTTARLQDASPTNPLRHTTFVVEEIIGKSAVIVDKRDGRRYHTSLRAIVSV